MKNKVPKLIEDCDRIIKNSYFNETEPFLYEDYDIKKWYKVSKQIYYASQNSYGSIYDIINEKTSGMSERERERFEKWISYYIKNEHKKYSEEKSMKKKAIYQFSPTMYGADYNPASSQFIQNLSDLEPDNNSEKIKKDKKTQKTWIDSCHNIIRQLDRVLRYKKDIPHDSLMAYRKLLYELDSQLLSDQNKSGKVTYSTAVDLTAKTGLILNRLGMSDAGSRLIKHAQEAPIADPRSEVAVEQPPEEEVAQDNTPTEDVDSRPQSREDQLRDSIRKSEPVDLTTIKPIDNSDDKYEDLEGDVDISKAAAKLEEVAGMLSDRRVIRNLAEFDIMLDKLGIANMFPELAESQAKLIDSYGYALTRVSKMLGMLANSQTLVEMSALQAEDNRRSEEDRIG